MRYVTLALLLVGCGPSVDNRFAGSWTGSYVFTVRSTNTQPNVTSRPDGRVELRFAEGGLLSVNLCGNLGDGWVKLEGGGGHAEWDGIQSCPVAMTNCATASLVIRHASYELEAGPHLNSVMSGDALSCGFSGTFTGEFSGTK